MTRRETFREARARIMAELEAMGWTITTRATRAPWGPLTTPYADRDDGMRLWFKPQAVYVGPRGDTRSVESDVRGESAEDIVRSAEFLTRG